jgi:hypothetical protein
VLELHDVWVAHHADDLQLAVLEPLVLQHLLDGNLQAGGRGGGQGSAGQRMQGCE